LLTQFEVENNDFLINKCTTSSLKSIVLAESNTIGCKRYRDAFWVINSITATEFPWKGSILTSESLKESLTPTIRTKQHGLLFKGAHLHHNNAGPPTTQGLVAPIKELST
jgi:hypothetical protein